MAWTCENYKQEVGWEGETRTLYRLTGDLWEFGIGAMETAAVWSVIQLDESWNRRNRAHPKSLPLFGQFSDRLLYPNQADYGSC